MNNPKPKIPIKTAADVRRARDAGEKQRDAGVKRTCKAREVSKGPWFP